MTVRLRCSRRDKPGITLRGGRYIVARLAGRLPLVRACGWVSEVNVATMAEADLNFRAEHWCSEMNLRKRA